LNRVDRADGADPELWWSWASIPPMSR